MSILVLRSYTESRRLTPLRYAYFLRKLLQAANFNVQQTPTDPGAVHQYVHHINELSGPPEPPASQPVSPSEYWPVYSLTNRMQASSFWTNDFFPSTDEVLWVFQFRSM